MKCVVTIELASIPKEIKNKDLMPGCKNRRLSLHEALCKAIHENDSDAMDWLINNVVDVSI